MNVEKIRSKFGGEYILNEATYVMGINYRAIERIANRFKNCERVLDACCGAGFIGIGLAKQKIDVIAVDINLSHLKMARQNAKIADVEQRMRFILGDVSSDEVLKSVGEIDGANLDMDWATGNDKRVHVTSLSQMIPPAYLLFQKVSKKTRNISIRLPKELNLKELDAMPPHELEEVYLDGDFKFYMTYFGNLISKVGDSRLEL